MRKILFALAMIAFGGFSVNAQTPATAKKHSRHKKEIPQNFQVCKNNSGYHICDETPAPHNSTHPGMTIKEEKPYVSPNSYVEHRRWYLDAGKQAKGDGGAPQSQSFPENIYTVYGVGNPYLYPHHIVLGPFDYND